MGKRASKANTDSDFYQQILTSIEDYAVFTTDKGGFITSWNSGAAHVLGYTEKEALQKNSEILFTKADIAAQEPSKELSYALKHGRALDERFHVRKDGTRFWASGKVFPLYDPDGAHIGFTKIMRNLTDRMQAEERVTRARRYAEEIIAWAAEPIIVLNEDLTVNNVNAAFRECFRAITKKNFNLPLSKFAGGSFDKAEFKAVTNDLMSARGNVLNREVALELQSGDDRILLVNGRKVSPEPGLTFYMLSLQDITEQRLLEQQKDDFISIASHEIRTPLTVIKATAQILQLRHKGFENAEVTKAAGKINEKTDKLLNLLKYLLDASQIDASNMVLRPVHFSLNGLVKESVAELFLIYPGIAIEVRGSIKEPIWGDRIRISQVLNNLLNNAIKYSPPDERLIVKLRKNKKGDQAIISVQDFGIGIPKEEQRHLFKRFWRASTAKRRNIAGIGLGLYISSQIISQHQGKMWLKSEKDQGSTFSFAIPLSPDTN